MLPAAPSRRHRQRFDISRVCVCYSSHIYARYLYCARAHPDFGGVSGTCSRSTNTNTLTHVRAYATYVSAWSFGSTIFTSAVKRKDDNYTHYRIVYRIDVCPTPSILHIIIVTIIMFERVKCLFNLNVNAAATDWTLKTCETWKREAWSRERERESILFAEDTTIVVSAYMQNRDMLGASGVAVTRSSYYEN